MNNQEQMTRDNSILKRIGKGIINILKHIVMLPVYLIKGIRWLAKYIYNSFSFSLRRSITANYLVLYFIVVTITVASISIGYLVHTADDAVLSYEEEVQGIVNLYLEGRRSEDNTVQSLAQYAKENDCGFFVLVDYQGEASESLVVGDVVVEEAPKGILHRIRLFFSDKIYVEQQGILTTSDTLSGSIIIIQHLRPFYPNLLQIDLLLLIMLGLGGIFIATFGNMNIRRIISPLYTMTLTAKKLSINDMENRLDVSKAKYELRDLAITLNDMLDRLGEDYAKQKRFVSDVSHELRTPISIVNGYANMLERWGKKDEDILNESIDAIISEAKSMQVLVENLLTLVRSDNQTLQFDFTIFDIGELVSEVCKETAMINEKGQEISCDVHKDITVNLDLQKIKQMLRIFTDNAVKYTPDKGEIVIQCYQEGDECHIHIKDTGIGIDKVDLPYLFDRFYRSDESRTRQTGGHGLGLSIAKVIVIGHGGSIKVMSKVNVGSEFIITLPVYNDNN